MRRPQGRPAYQPTDQNRQTVQVLKANGNSDVTIARVLGIDEKTLRKYYRAELDHGFTQVKALVGAAVVRSAMQGNVGAQKFWLACYGGPEWKVVRPEDEVMIPAGGGTTIIIKGGLPPTVYQDTDPPRPNGSNGHAPADEDQAD